MKADTSGSSRTRIDGAISSTVVLAPSRENTWANSRPIGPPPSTTTDSGSSFWSKTVSWFQCPASASPGIGGVEGSAPVASTMRLERMRPTPSTSTVVASRKRAAPK